MANWPSPLSILGVKPCPLNNVIANTTLYILILNVQLILQQLQFFQVVLVHLWLVPHQLKKVKFPMIEDVENLPSGRSVQQRQWRQRWWGWGDRWQPKRQRCGCHPWSRTSPNWGKNEIQWRSLFVIEPPDDHDLDEKEKDAENSGEPPGQLYDLTHFRVRWLEHCAGSLQGHH